MRSAVERRAARAFGVALALLLAVGPLAAQDEPPASPGDGQAPTREQIDAALAQVKADPNLATERTVRTLKWRSEPSERELPAWLDWLYVLLKWIAGLFNWLAQSGRALLWVLAGLLAALLVVYLVRIVRARGAPRLPGRFVAPSHVRDLDIRPESLPPDIGAAAALLWDQGEQRAALALLYRGLLSRLVHVHGVPIRDSSTEGDCLVLAAPRLSGARNDYAARLVRVWQGAVYGAEHPSSPAVHGLCAEFSGVLDPPVAPPETPAASAEGEA